MIIRRLLCKSSLANALPKFSHNKTGNSASSKSSPLLSKFNPQDIKSKLANLENNINQFADQYNLVSTTAKNSPLNYVAMFARSCLIARSKIPWQESFVTIKKSIVKEGNKLCPQSCTALMESLVYYKFEGDQNNVINKLCDYYQNYHNLFTQNQQLIFWESYLRIMTEKTHSSVKFRNLQRKNKNTIQFSKLSDIIKKSVDFNTINKKIIKQITYEDENTVYITMSKPKTTKNILLKLKGIPNVNEIHRTSDKGMLDNTKKLILDEIMDLNSNLKKGWNTIIFGENLRNQSKKQEYQYKYVNVSSSQAGHEGFWKTQRKQQAAQLNQTNLNDEQFTSELKQSNQYIQGIYYNSPNLNVAEVDMMATLMLGVNPKNLTQSAIKFISQGRITEPGQFQRIFDYISLHKLRQCYGYAKICGFQQKLYNSYVNIQGIIDLYRKNDEQSYFGLSLYKKVAAQLGISDEQLKKTILSDTQLMSEMSVHAANNVQNLRFNKSYNEDYKNVHRYPGNYAADMFWQMKPTLGDTIKIMSSIESLLGNLEQSRAKQVKVMIISTRQSIPHLVSNILEARYWTIPKYTSTNERERQAKNIIFEQLFKQSASNQ